MHTIRQIVAYTIAMTAILDSADVSKAEHIVFDFDPGFPDYGVAYGTPSGYPALASQGFVFDVMKTSGPSGHFHVIDSIAESANKVPDRPMDDRGVLWSDGETGGYPLFVTLDHAPSSLFNLESLLVGSSTVDNCGTFGVRLTASLGGVVVGSVDLAVSGNKYVSYSGAGLGTLQGLAMDRLQFESLSSTGIAYFQLDDLAFRTFQAVPEPLSLFPFALGLTGLLGHSRWRRAKSSTEVRTSVSPMFPGSRMMT